MLTQGSGLVLPFTPCVFLLPLSSCVSAKAVSENGETVLIVE
jgi:hypothetical protein